MHLLPILSLPFKDYLTERVLQGLAALSLTAACVIAAPVSWGGAGAAGTGAAGGGITFIGTEVLDVNGTRETIDVLKHMRTVLNQYLSVSALINDYTNLKTSTWPWVHYIAFWYDPFRTRLHSYHTTVNVQTEELAPTTWNEPDETYHPRIRNLIEERRLGELRKKFITLEKVKNHLNWTMGPERAGN